MSTVIPTSLPGVLRIQTRRFADSRGFFQELHREAGYRDLGIDCHFVQSNWSRSHQSVLRGMHYQLTFPQSKLITVVRGAVLDVAVDLRRSSPCFGKWTAHVLSEENGEQLFVPRGHGHGFLVLSETADILYQVDDVYHPEDDWGIRWSDPDLKLPWQNSSPTLSAKDAALPFLAELPESQLPA